MAISGPSLANAALIEIGGPQIVSFDDENSEAARIMTARFDQLLDEEVARGSWTFATSRKQLAAESVGPDFGWEYQHVLPANPWCLRVLEEVNDYEYVVEGRKILSDDTPMQIRFIRRVTDLNELSAEFRASFIFRLAAVLAIPIRGSRTLRDSMVANYIDALRYAKSMDAMINDNTEQADGSWLDAHGGE